MTDWSAHFDAVFCLSLADNISRRNLMHWELKRVGILDSGIFHWKITVKNEFYKFIWSNPGFPWEDWWRHMSVALNCTMGHYEIMKESLARGFRQVLIIEDDVRFLKDTNEIDNLLNTLPDYDICLFEKNTPWSKDAFHEAVQNNRVNDAYIDFSGVNFGGTGCLALSTKAMETITKAQERLFQPADFPVNRVDHSGNVTNDDGLRRVASIRNMAVQDMRLKYDGMSEIDKTIYVGIADLNDYL